MKALEALPPAVVTVRVRAPVVAVAATVTGTVMEVAVTVAVPVVMPVPLKARVAPVRLVPLIVRVLFVAPWDILVGEILPMVGAAVAAATVNDGRTVHNYGH